MTCIRKTGVLFALVMLLHTAASAAQDYSTARDVLLANVEATGGADAWAAVRTVRASTEMVMESQMGAFVMTMESWVITGSHMYTKVKILDPPPGLPPGAGENELYITPDGGFVKGFEGRQTLDQLPAQQREQMTQGLDVNRASALLEQPDSLLTLLPDEEFEGVLSHVIEVGGSVTSKMYFDAESLLLVAAEVASPMGSAVSRISDYREVGGVLMSFVQTMDLGAAGGVQTIRVKKLEINTEITPEMLEEMVGQ